MTILVDNSKLKSILENAEDDVLEVAHTKNMLIFDVQKDLYILDCSTETGLYTALGLKAQFPNVNFIFYSKNKNDLFSFLHFKPIGFFEYPFNKNNILLTMKTIRKQIDSQFIYIKSGLELRRIRISDIMYVNIESRNIAYHCTDEMILGNTLQQSFAKNITNLVPKYSEFIFIEPSILINMYHVKRLEGDYVEFFNGDKCYFPRTKYRLLAEVFKQGKSY